MLADIAALILLALVLSRYGPIPRPKWKASNITNHEWLILGCLVVASCLGWLSNLINNDFKGFDSPPPPTEVVRGK